MPTCIINLILRYFKIKIMWRLNRVPHKAARAAYSLEEFRVKRREQEKALRQARRDRQLVSKRLLVNEDEGQQEVTMDTCSYEKDVVSLFHKLQHSGPEREAHLKTLTKSLRDPSAQLVFIKQENSIHMLVGLLTGPNTLFRLQSVRCLHELSHSPHPSVAAACLPATPYLLTYLSGQSTRFTVLCLYTLGNLCPDSDVREKLLAQGVIPALASCIENQKHNMAVVEAVGFTLSQLLQTKDAAEKIIPLVLASSLPSHLLAVLTPDQNFSVGPAIECAWCLHYLTSSGKDNGALLACGALLRCSSLLVSLGGAVAQGNKEEGLELLLCPLLRCVGNLLSSCTPDVADACLSDVGLVVALCALLQAYVKTRPSLAREISWVLNNLTAQSNLFCSALMTFHLVPSLIQLLPFSQGINTMILRVLANVAHKKKEFCIQLAEIGLLSSLFATLKMAEREVVTLSLDILFMLLTSGSQVVEDFVKEGGISLLETLQYHSEGDVKRRATYLLESHLLSSSSQRTVSCNSPS
ncbi:transmembrane and coiled-coil domain-containing protein 6 isoform X2 [Vanacampus margaritifer]